MEAKHWGEYESLCDNSEEEVDFEVLDTYVDHKASVREKLKLYLPYDEDDTGELVQVPEECVEMDGRVVHTVKLLQHSRALKELLSNAYALQNGTGQSVYGDRKHLPEPPLLPDGPIKASKYTFNYPFRYMEKELSEFSEGEGIPPVTLSLTVTRQILRKSIATLLAHIGFETTGVSVLEVLCDICHEYMQKITKLMRVAADREATAGMSGFPDIMERVFHEMGIGSVCSLHSFYQSRIIMYHARMMHTCRLLDEEYQTLRRSLCLKGEEATLRAKIDEDEDDVPEIHFPAYGEGEADVGMLQPSLETGFKMLQSLEQESQAQLQQQQLAAVVVGGGGGGGGGSEQDDEDEEEVINVSDLPGHELSSAVADLTHSGGQNKPRKRKRKNNS